MELQYFGANCILVDVNKALFIIDPSEVGRAQAKKEISKSHVLLTGFYPVEATNDPEKLTISYPGEYEIDGVAIKGIQTKSHLAVHDTDSASNVIYTFRTGDINLCILGNPEGKLTDDILEQIGTVDVLVLPVGGGGLTLSSLEASSLVKAIDPKICVATHFDDGVTSYEVPQGPVTDFFEEIGSGEKLEDKKFKIKASDLSEEGLRVVALNI